ncbi:MAG: UbiA family prenyltransferase [Chloroflexales bacterium]
MVDAYRFFRFSAFGATAALPLLGAGSTEPQLGVRRTLGLLGVAAAFHAFAYVHNDVCDLEIDRTQPLRADYPLVRGDMSSQAALVIALGCVPVAFALDRWVVHNNGRDAPVGRLDAPRDAPVGRLDAPPGRLYLASAFVLMAAYNRWGKMCAFPPLTDLVQGAGWALLIGYGATVSGQPVNRLTRTLIAYELLLILMVNGVHGSLRDLGNDRARGARTTAIMLGAEETPDGLRVGPELIAYAAALQCALLALPLWAARGRIPTVGVGAIASLTAALLAVAGRGGATPADVGMLHLILLLSAPMALVVPEMGRPLRIVTLLAHTLPLLANGMTYDALRWVLRAAARRCCVPTLSEPDPSLF